MKKEYFRLVEIRAAKLLFCAMLFPTMVNAQSLEQAVAFTFDHHPELRVAYSRFKVSEQQIKQAESGYWPTIDFTAGIGYEYTAFDINVKDDEFLIEIKKPYIHNHCEDFQDRFLKALTDFELREQINRETAPIRNAIWAQAFSPKNQ